MPKRIVKYDEKLICASGIETREECNEHRFSLYLPIITSATNTGNKVVHVIGQNPSKANKEVSDRTINFVVSTVVKNIPDAAAIRMLNLYSKYDTKKEAQDADHPNHLKYLKEELTDATDVWFICGKLKKQGAYDFPARFLALGQYLNNKRVWTLDVYFKGSQVPYFTHPRRLCFKDTFQGKLVYAGKLRKVRR